ncbi:MAG: type II toxin-antitoxin system VapC family toxin [Deltaproteobacteria bacterium]|nr:type II toxin-antitoxin system VapC family toxin [Deltaproteobacteria bacterium]
MLFDTDILIWIQKGNIKAAHLVDNSVERLISVQTYMELLQCAQNKKQLTATRNFLTDFDFKVLPLSENIGHRASIYLEEYSLACGLRAGDAIIAATATENNLILSSSNAKHFKAIRDLKLKVFKP